jgi:RNA-directed DNA polymerase
MGRTRQPNRQQLVFPVFATGEAPREAGRVEPPVAAPADERPATTERLMERVVDTPNMKGALKRVQANRGAPGVDGMTVRQLPGYLKKHWPTIREQLLSGTYQPQPVKRVEIPKPGGGVRVLGIPTVLDRFIQQAILQVLQPEWDATFSDHSFGFRPGRSAHQAVARAQAHIGAGYEWVVDIDLEQFFDRVNHDMLMGRVAKRVGDKRLLKLIRAYLNAGMMAEGVVVPRDRGTPQGGPLSPLLSNLLLDDLDRELERRGHRFVRYADDCNIYVRSARAGQRVMASVTRFLERKLKLKVNAEKSAVARPWQRKFLGFSFLRGERPKRKLARETVERFKREVRKRTRRSRGISRQEMVRELSVYLRGWRAYFGYFCETRTELSRLDSWIRRRLRCFVWRQWKHSRRRYEQLRKLGVREALARNTAGSGRGPWHLSNCQALHYALPNACFVEWGLVSVAAPRDA